jgi:rhodanese-related sulfurtransferase
MNGNRRLRFAAMKTYDADGIPTVDPEGLSDLSGARLIDVRRPDEFSGELGHLEGAELHPLGQDLERFLATAPRDATYVFVCRVGGRSAHATALAMAAGFPNVANLAGGMVRWHSRKLPTVR